MMMAILVSGGAIAIAYAVAGTIALIMYRRQK